MSTSTGDLGDAVRAFLQNTCMTREDPVLARLREATAPLEMAGMQIAVEQGLFMALLARLLGARRTLEVGVFTGYSALCVARVLPPDGRLVACDVSEEWTTMARRFWTEAGVADRIDLRLAPGLETLAALTAAGEDGTYDFAFVDADKEGYIDYYEACLPLMRSGGLIAFDNAFRGGRLADPEADDEGTRVMRALHDLVFRDARVDPALVPIGDGLLLARRR